MRTPLHDTGWSSRLHSQAARSILFRYGILLVGSAISILLSRVLEASGRGAYAYIVAVASTLTWIAHLSVEWSLMVAWSSAERRDQLVGAAFTVALMSGGVICLLGFGWLTLFNPDLPNGVETWMVVVGIASLPGALVGLYGNSVLANDGRIGELNLIAFVAASFQLAAIVTLVWLEQLTPASAIIIWSLSIALPAVLLITRMVPHPGLARPRSDVLRSITSTGIRYHLGAISLALILRVDVLLLGTRVSVAQIGIYSLAVSLAELALVATGARAQVAIQVQIRGEPGSQKEFTASTVRTNALLALVLLISIGALGPFLVTPIFGESYEGTMLSVLLLAPGMLAFSMINPLAVFVIRLGRPAPFVMGTLSGLVLNVVLNILLIPHWGIEGAAAASTVVYALILLWLSTWFVKVSHMPISSLIPDLRDLRTSGRLLGRS